MFGYFRETGAVGGRIGGVQNKKKWDSETGYEEVERIGKSIFPAVHLFEKSVKISGQDLIDTKYMGSLCH